MTNGAAPLSTLRSASMRSRSVRAPALSSGSLRLPHFGLCTHDGQPAAHGQRCRRRVVSSTQSSKRSKPRSVMPDAARVAVVDEDRRAAGLVVDVRREAADVPAVAHRPQRQERDEAVLGGVERAEELRHLLETFELSRLGAEPDRLRLEGRLRHEHRHDVDRRAVAHRLARVADHLLGHRDAAEVELDAEALARISPTPRSSSPTPSSPACTSRRAPARRPRRDPRARATRRGTARRGGGRRRLRAPSSRRGRARRDRGARRSRRRRR